MTRKITHRPLLPQNGGRPFKQPPRNCADQIEALAADGFSIVGIAKKLNTTFEVFKRWLEENPELQAAFDNGREHGRWQLHNMLFKKAIEKQDTVAALFLLKTRHGYLEGDQRDTGNKVQINFQLPGAYSMDDFNKLIKVIPNGQSNNTDEPISAERLIIARGN